MSIALFILVCAIWGSSFVLMKEATQAFGPIAVAAGRVLGGAAFLAIIWRWHRIGWPFAWRDAIAIALLATLGNVVPFIIQPQLLRRGYDSGFTGMLVSLVPLATVLASLVMLRAVPTVRQWIGVIGGLAFAALLFRDQLGRGLTWEDLPLAAAVPISYAVANTYVKRRFAGVPAFALASCAMAVAGLAMLPVSATTESVETRHLVGSLAALLVLGVLGSGVAIYAFYTLIQKHGPLYAGMVAYVIPCVAVVMGVVIYGERITMEQLVALTGILAMVAISQSQTPDTT